MLVSVIIPCFNVQDYIEECVTSVINQTYRNIEIICIDNNSNDQTWQILQKLKLKYPSIILEKELQSGANFARNFGFSIAKGEWIQFLDADDLLEKSKIQHQVDLIKVTDIKELGFIAGAWKNINTKDEVSLRNNLSTDVYMAPFINKAGNTCSNLWSTNALTTIKGWDNAIKSSQEVNLMLNLISNNFKFIIDTMPLTVIRQREFGQISHRYPLDKWSQFIEVRLDFLKKLKDTQPSIYIQNSSMYYDFLMVSLIELAKYDFGKAVLIYNKDIKENWTSGYLFGFSKLKLFIIKYFGINAFFRIFT